MDSPSAMFDDAEMGTLPTPQGYQVLARKYRPSTFEDMIGQQAMVTTLTNAFKTGRIAHAFMLTGVRGIGKTTTARLLARALNYETETQTSPSVDFTQKGIHCDSIMASSHMDVLEMDAASRTGVENMREMLDGVRYSPVSARYKVYIIDEVHMLSTGAFNALLKTLEEPPEHAKFIFATTEIRKVPITVLSRCQRFDLRRVEAEALQAHLANICVKEKASVSAEGLALIARAAEGSVRDGLSLLDQAIVQSADDNDAPVSFEQVRSMLGLADRVRVLDLFLLATQGDAPAMLAEIRAQYDHGADPAVIMRDLLELCHEVSRAKALGDQASFEAAPDQIERIRALADTLTMGQLTRIWQLLLKAHMDVKMAPSPLAAAEMALLRLCVATELPPPEWAAQILQRGGDLSPSSALETASGTTPKMAPETASGTTSETVLETASGTGALSPDLQKAEGPDASQIGGQAQLQSQINKPSPEASNPDSHLSAHQGRLAPIAVSDEVDELSFTSLAQIVDHLYESGQKSLAHMAERYIRLVSLGHDMMSFALEPGAPKDLASKLKLALGSATGRDWSIIIDAQAEGEPSLREQQKRADEARRETQKNHPEIAKALLAFPDADITVRKRISDNIIEADFTPQNGDS